MSKALGTPVVRADAVAKVTGAAQYAADHVQPGVLHAALATSTITRGRIVGIDSRTAERVPGMRLVLSHQNLGDRIGEGTLMVPFLGGQFQSSFNPLASDEIRYAGQIVALVVADTIEAAEQAAQLIQPEYEPHPTATISLDDVDLDDPQTPVLFGIEVGDAQAELAESEVVIDQQYRTSINHHNPIELFNVTATWRDDLLEVRLPSQWVSGERFALANVLGLPEQDVRVISPYIGGAFGSKGATFWHTVFTAEAARRLRASVKLFITRRQMFTVGPFRPQSHHAVKLGANRDGRLTAYQHEIVTQTSRSDLVVLPGTDNTGRLYAYPSILTRESSVPVDANTPGFMRGPLEFPQTFALESAMDELATALDVDPVELRLRNEPDKEPVQGLPYSSRSLVECYRRGAQLFGWGDRDHRVGSMRGPDGELIGWGCASASYPVFGGSVCDCRVTIGADGRAHAEVAAQEIGTGTYTSLAQICADAIGLRVQDVTVSLGDTDLPRGLPTAASSTTAAVGSAVHATGLRTREQLLAAAAGYLGMPPDGRNGEALTVEDGVVQAPDGRRVPVAQIVERMPGGVLTVEERYVPPNLPPELAKTTLEEHTMNFTGPIGPQHVSFSYGANFVEIGVHPTTRRIRLGRMVGVFGVGRVINPRITRSLLMGGMIWGAGHALLEKTVMDRGRATFVNTDLAGYHISTNADIAEVIVETVEERDDAVSPLGAKGGVGEMGIVGMPAAVANAIHHATGIRVRTTPILIDDLLVG